MGAIPVPGLAEQEGFIWTRQQPIGAPAARLPANRYGWGSTQLATTRTASAAASSAAMPQDAAPVIALDRPSWVLAAQLEQSLQSSRAVPAMHTAHEGARRLALAAALAKQHLDLGLPPPVAAASPKPQLKWHLAAECVPAKPPRLAAAGLGEGGNRLHASAVSQHGTRPHARLASPALTAQQQQQQHQGLVPPAALAASTSASAAAAGAQQLPPSVAQHQLQRQLWELRAIMLANSARPPVHPDTGAKAVRRPSSHSRQPVPALAEAHELPAGRLVQIGSRPPAQVVPSAEPSNDIARLGSKLAGRGRQHGEPARPAPVSRQYEQATGGLHVAAERHPDAHATHGMIHIMQPAGHQVERPHASLPAAAQPHQTLDLPPDPLGTGAGAPPSPPLPGITTRPTTHQQQIHSAQAAAAGPRPRVRKAGQRPTYVCGALAWPARPGAMRDVSNQQKQDAGFDGPLPSCSTAQAAQQAAQIAAQVAARLQLSSRVRGTSSQGKRRQKKRPCWDNCILTKDGHMSAASAAKSRPASCQQGPQHVQQQTAASESAPPAFAMHKEQRAAEAAAQTSVGSPPAAPAYSNLCPAAVPVSLPPVSQSDPAPAAASLAATEDTSRAQRDRIAQLEQRMAGLVSQVEARLQQREEPPQQSPHATQPGPGAGNKHGEAAPSQLQQSQPPAGRRAGLAAKAKRDGSLKLSSPEDLAALLQRLDQTDQVESRVRARWLPGVQSPQHSTAAVPTAAPLQGQPCGSHGVDGPPSHQQPLPGHVQAAQQPRTAQQDTQHVQHEPEQQSVAEHAAAEAPTAQRSAVSEDLVERVLVARQRFVRHQKQLDEGLVRAGLRAPNHIKVAEECADMLLDELLQESACEVDQICDDFCDQLFASEFLEP